MENGPETKALGFSGGRLPRGLSSWVAVGLLLFCSLVGGATDTEGDHGEPSCDGSACTVVYEAAFFSRYAPVTALDMTSNLPGFSLDDGDGSRGFAGSAGNLLVDGRRVSSKSELPSDVLSRIPAGNVERIEVIRGQTGGTDIRGQTVIANVVRRNAGPSGAWEVGGNAFQSGRGFYPFINASGAAKAGSTSVTLGVEGSRYLRVRQNEESVLGQDRQLLEFRDEEFRETGYNAKATLQLQSTVGKTAVRLNANYAYFDEAGGETSFREPLEETPFVLFQGDTDERDAFELGADFERPLNQKLAAKFIALYREADYLETGSLLFQNENRLESTTSFRSIDDETILRMELDFAGIEGHLIEAAVESAVNRLDSSFALFLNEDGDLVSQEVPGAETRVKEERLDITLSDSFSVGPLSFDVVLAAETSTITQTGGFAEKRDFSFFKPGLILTYAPDERLQFRLRAQREVGQLDFFDFVSAADLGDVELSLGNPNLSPETTVAIEASVERRFGELGVLTVTGFHDEISDVQDVLPLEGILEVPGNIGDGSRTGVSGNATLPLASMGLTGARLDISGRWQTSSVTDPLNGTSRRLSGERRFQGNIAFRQDLTAKQFAWGGDVSFFDEVPEFGLDERDMFQRGVDVDAFVETRAVAGLRIRVGVENLLREGNDRERKVFSGPRSNGVLSFTEVRDATNPRQYYIAVSGTF